MSIDLKNETIESLHAAFLAGTTTPLLVAEACLNQIAAIDKTIGAFLHIDDQDVLEQAKASTERYQSGHPLSVLDGIPIGLKANFLLEGQPCTAGSKILENFVAPYDGGAVRRLKEAGAVLTGSMNCDEFAMGSSNENAAYQKCLNPWNTEYVPGGSSGGSAAGVAGSMVIGSLGTETGGSVRLPASFCGLVGLKPSYGRVSRFGVVAFASSLDQIGPFAKNVTDCRHIYNHIQGFDERDTTTVKENTPISEEQMKAPLAGQKIGIADHFTGEGLSEEVRTVVNNALETYRSLGAEVVHVDLPHTKYCVATYYILATAEAASNLARYDGVRYGPRLGEEDGLDSLYQKTRGQLFGDEVKRRILLGNYVLSAGYYDAYYRKAQKVRRLIAEDFEKAFKDCDVILTPTSPTPAFKLGSKSDDPLEMYLSDIYTASVNLAGNCALSLNGGFSKNGLPIGVQLIGGIYQEEKIFNAAFHLEQALGLDNMPS